MTLTATHTAILIDRIQAVALHIEHLADENRIFPLYTYELGGAEATRQVLAHRWSKAEATRFFNWVGLKMNLNGKGDDFHCGWITSCRDRILAEYIVEYVCWYKRDRRSA